MVVRWVNVGRAAVHGCQPSDRRGTGAGPAVPRLRGLRRARQGHRHQSSRRAPRLVPVPQGRRRARPEHRAGQDPDDPGRGDPAAAVGHHRRPVRDPEPGRGAAARPARADRRQPRPHRRSRRSANPSSATTARRARRSCCTTSSPAAPATSPSWRIRSGCGTCCTGHGSGSATAPASTSSGWPATGASSRSPRPAGLNRVSRSAAERHLRAILTSGTPDAERRPMR